MEWEDMQVKGLSIQSEKGGSTTLIHGQESLRIKLEPGEKLDLKF